MNDYLTTNFEKVGVFMEACDQHVESMAKFPDDKICKLRNNLIKEEYEEFQDAVKKNDLVAVADALSDLLYVVYGTGHAFGINLDSCFAEVHRSNMTKTVDGKCVKSPEGKILKGADYTPPNLADILNTENTEYDPWNFLRDSP